MRLSANAFVYITHLNMMALLRQTICVFLVFQLYLGIVQSGVTVLPSNKAVFAGKWMSMQCRVNNGTVVYQWEMAKPVTERKEIILVLNEGKVNIEKPFEHFGCDMDEYGSGMIYTNSTKVGDAGLYWCTVEEPDNNNDRKYGAHLLVFEKVPLCETNYSREDKSTAEEGDYIWMRCSVNFTGLLTPDMEWRQHTIDGNGTEDVEGQVIINGTTTVIDCNSSITSTLITEFSFRNSSKSYFTCKLYFTSVKNIRDEKATNIPDFTYIWKSPVIVPPVGQTQPPTVIVDLSSFAPAEVHPVKESDKPEKSEGNWYGVLLILVVVVLVVVVIGFVTRRCVQYRRNMNIRTNPSGPLVEHLTRNDTSSSSGFYDDIPNAPQNVYEGIDDHENSDIKFPDDSPQCQQHHSLNRCYSHLSEVTDAPASTYATLRQSEKPVEEGNDAPGSEPLEGQTDEESSQVIDIEQYTIPMKATISMPHDYLALVVDGEDEEEGGGPSFNNPTYSLTSAGNIRPECIVKPVVVKSNDDYLMPSEYF